jgi:hypothetical protein
MSSLLIKKLDTKSIFRFGSFLLLLEGNEFIKTHLKRAFFGQFWWTYRGLKKLNS